MRQAGFLAAAGSYALNHHIERLQYDHDQAKALAKALNNVSEITQVWEPETNILVAELESSQAVDTYLNDLKARGVLAVRFGSNMIRFVTHLGISEKDLILTTSLL